MKYEADCWFLIVYFYINIIFCINMCIDTCYYVNVKNQTNILYHKNL